MNTENSNLLDSLLDQDLSEIEDLPSYEVPPNGYYRLEITKAEQKTVKIKGGTEDAPVLDIGYKVLEVLQLSDPSKDGEIKKNKDGVITQEFNESFFFHSDPKKTKEVLKNVFKEVGEGLGLSNLMQIINALKGLEVFATVTQSKKKNDDGTEKVFARVQNVKLTTA